MSAPIVCPAGLPLSRVTGTPSVLCGELDLANDGAELNGSRASGHVSPVMDGDRDQVAVAVYCKGDGVPGALNSYCSCPIWRAAREAQWARRTGPDALRDEQAVRPPTGVREELLELAAARV